MKSIMDLLREINECQGDYETEYGDATKGLTETQIHLHKAVDIGALVREGSTVVRLTDIGRFMLLDKDTLNTIMGVKQHDHTDAELQDAEEISELKSLPGIEVVNE